MKKLFVAAYLSAFAIFSAQSLEFGIGAGTGSTYILENADAVNISYKAPVSVKTELKYTPANSNFGVSLRYQHTNTSVSGQRWFDTAENFDAIVSDNSLFLLLEYLKNSPAKWSFGGNVGLGFTSQNIDFSTTETREYRFPTLNISGVAQYKINEKWALKLEPGFQFADPFSALKIKSYNFAKEDIHFLALLGFSYKL